jgi:FkbM family methyltransferase
MLLRKRFRLEMPLHSVNDLKIALVRALTPKADNSRNRVVRLLSRFVPMLWVRPDSLRGLQLLIDPMDWSQTLIFDEIFVRETYDLRRLPFTPAIIIDCGAHIGMFSLLATAAFPSARLIAFEPNPKNVAAMRKQIDGNSLNFELIEAAVSTTEGHRSFVMPNSHSGKLADSGSSGAVGFKVRLVDLGKFVERNPTQRLLLKIDVEGEEEAIFPALLPRLPTPCAIFFETHSGHSGWTSISRQLTTYGFSVEIINSRGLYTDGYACRT